MRVHTLAEAMTYGRGTERPFLCPVHGDSRPSASVNMIKKVWYCYSCGAHGGLTGEYALIEPDAEELKRWFAELMEVNRVYPEAWLSRYDAGEVHPYWRERVGSAAARHFRLGFDPGDERTPESVTYPLRGVAEGVLGVVRRPLARGDGPKYLYPRGVDVSRLLFNYTPVYRRAVVLVEGALDAIALWNVGVPAFAIYGSRLSEQQVRLIDRVDPEIIYTAYDLDEAGWRAHRDTERAFKHRLVSRLVWPLVWGKDVDEIGPEKLAQVVSQLVSQDMSCVESPSCASSPARRTSSVSSSKPRRLVIVPRVA